MTSYPVTPEALRTDLAPFDGPDQWRVLTRNTDALLGTPELEGWIGVATAVAPETIPHRPVSAAWLETALAGETRPLRLTNALSTRSLGQAGPLDPAKLREVLGLLGEEDCANIRELELYGATDALVAAIPRKAWHHLRKVTIGSAAPLAPANMVRVAQWASSGARLSLDASGMTREVASAFAKRDEPVASLALHGDHVDAETAETLIFGEVARELVVSCASALGAPSSRAGRACLERLKLPGPCDLTAADLTLLPIRELTLAQDLGKRPDTLANWSEGTYLSTLRLARCGLKDEVLRRVLAAPCVRPVRHLDVSENALGAKGGRWLAETDALPHVEQVDVHRTKIGDRSLQKLIARPGLRRITVGERDLGSKPERRAAARARSEELAREHGVKLEIWF